MRKKIKCELYNDKQENWKDIAGYEGLYMVSNTGKIYSFYKNKELKQTINDRGYKAVSLCKDGVRKVREVHRIVAETFINNLISGYAEVNHKDGIKTNNNVANLEWVTKGDNLRHAYQVLHRKTVGKQIRCVDTGTTYESAAEAARATGINPSAIRQVLSGLKNKAGGVKWERL